MKKFLLPMVLLSLFVSCGDKGDENKGLVVSGEEVFDAYGLQSAPEVGQRLVVDNNETYIHYEGSVICEYEKMTETKTVIAVNEEGVFYKVDRVSSSVKAAENSDKCPETYKSNGNEFIAKSEYDQSKETFLKTFKEDMTCADTCTVDFSRSEKGLRADVSGNFVMKSEEGQGNVNVSGYMIFNKMYPWLSYDLESNMTASSADFSYTSTSSVKKQDSVDGEVLTDFFSKNMENKKFKSLYTGDEHDLTKDEKGKYIYSVEKQSYQYGSAMCEYAIQKEVVGSYKFEADSSHSLVLLENKALLNADSLSESEVKECYDAGTFVEVRKVEVNDSGEIEVRYEGGNGVLNILSPM